MGSRRKCAKQLVSFLLSQDNSYHIVSNPQCQLISDKILLKDKAIQAQCQQRVGQLSLPPEEAA